MLKPIEFTNELKELGYDFYAGVPDSLLKELCACITDTQPARNHVITANEGAAVALASGYHLSTGKAGVVYMQNSGTGNAVNPLLSLADPEVYSIPMLVIIGWRGEPGVKDEPQHIKQGRVQEALLSSLEYPFEVLESDAEKAKEQLVRLTVKMKESSGPVVLLVKKNSFDSYKGKAISVPQFEMNREQALKVLLESISPDDRIVSTTGKASREIYELREARGEDHSRDFLTVGSMGHTSMIALGMAQFLPQSAGAEKRKVYCVDGDGAVLMHMGSLAILAKQAPDNMCHILINNGAHDSVGGQPTIGFDIPFAELATSMGYKYSKLVTTAAELRTTLSESADVDGPVFIEVRTNKGAREDLGRPKTTPQENKQVLMEQLHK
ncbi:phosphonopyruvate decarboxylase [Spirochaeta dissipatitropha]